MKGKILWLSPPDATPAINVMNVWKKYFSESKDWAITTNKQDDYDIVFFGSDSTLDKEILEETSTFKICYFWGFPWFRLVSPPWVNHYRAVWELLRKCDMGLGGSVATFYQLCDFGIPASVCYAGIDSKTIDTVPTQKKELQVCACGRLVAHKSFDVLIRAVAMLKPKPKVVIIGNGEEGKNLNKLASDLKVNLKIKSVNDAEKIKEYKKSLCVVAPSIYEGFGMVPVEALFAGVPVVVRDILINREILKEYALYFTDVNDLANKLSYVVNNATKGNRQYVKNNFTFDKARERLNFFFQRAMEIQKEVKTKEKKILISSDDLCPLFLSYFKWWDSLKKKHPNLKLTCFVVPRWKDNANQDVSTNREFRDWFENRKEWVCCGVHGYTHGFPPECFGTEEEQMACVQKALSALKGYLPERWSFRPPGNHINNFTIPMLKKLGCAFLHSSGMLTILPDERPLNALLIETHTNDKNEDSIQFIFNQLDKKLSELEQEGYNYINLCDNQK